MNTAAKILLVEDDLNLGFLLTEYLEDEGYEVKLCRDGQNGFAALKRKKYDLCILDIMMPKMDGFQLATKIKKEAPLLPFLFVTAKSRKEDKLQGFHLGAEDFITKPFDEEELLCRIQVILRRQGKKEKETQVSNFQIGAYHFNYDLQQLRKGEQIHRLTEKENEVLRQLCLHKNQILKREDAVETIYGRRDYFLGRSFDVFISKIRKLLRDDPSVKIENVFKVGFILKVEE